MDRGPWSLLLSILRPQTTGRHADEVRGLFNKRWLGTTGVQCDPLVRSGEGVECGEGGKGEGGGERNSVGEI